MDGLLTNPNERCRIATLLQSVAPIETTPERHERINERRDEDRARRGKQPGSQPAWLQHHPGAPGELPTLVAQ